jgi:hypothetical protein
MSNRCFPVQKSLLIILLQVWSVACKYAFNPPKVRFQTKNYKNCHRLAKITFRRLGHRVHAGLPVAERIHVRRRRGWDPRTPRASSRRCCARPRGCARTPTTSRTLVGSGTGGP